MWSSGTKLVFTLNLLFMSSRNKSVSYRYRRNCPELNPMEKLWDQVQRSISNAAWQTLDAIESEIVDVLQPFWQSVSRVRRFLRRELVNSRGRDISQEHRIGK